MLGSVRLDPSAICVAAGVSAILIACTIISITGVRPPGEAEMLRQIEAEDSYLCGKFGMQAATQKFWDCMLDLADLRKRHMEMVAYYQVP